MITDLKLTQKMLPNMTKYDGFGKPQQRGTFVLIDSRWLDEALSELRGRRETKGGSGNE